MGEGIDVALPLAALEMALADRRPAPGLLHHSVRDSVYAAGAYRARLDAASALASMSRTGDCWDNAVAESFFASLEHELIADHNWATRADARRDIFAFIEVWYNRERQHSSLDYVSPVQYEQHRLAQSAQPPVRESGSRPIETRGYRTEGFSTASNASALLQRH